MAMKAGQTKGAKYTFGQDMTASGEVMNEMSARFNPPSNHSGTPGSLMKPSGTFPQEKMGETEFPRWNPMRKM